MKNDRYAKLLVVFFLGAVALLNSGCGYPDRHPGLVKIEGRPNTFRLAPLPVIPDRDDAVRGIRVYEFNPRYSLDSKLFWEITAVEWVKLKGYQVTVGQVPRGFKQIVPGANDKFIPVPGKRYIIAVSLAHPLAMPWGATDWVAE
jgi:hypothetical protein